MVAATLPGGTEPVAVWDVREPAWYRMWPEASSWAMEHLADANSTYRVEFFLVDAPFAVVWRYRRNEDGHVYHDRETDEPARADPVIQPLGELPPAHLLGMT